VVAGSRPSDFVERGDQPRRCLVGASRDAAVGAGAGPPLSLQWSDEIYEAAARRGNVEMLKWTQEHHSPPPLDASTCLIAAETGHLDVAAGIKQIGRVGCLESSSINKNI